MYSNKTLSFIKMAEARGQFSRWQTAYTFYSYWPMAGLKQLPVQETEYLLVQLICDKDKVTCILNSRIVFQPCPSHAVWLCRGHSVRLSLSRSPPGVIFNGGRIWHNHIVIVRVATTALMSTVVFLIEALENYAISIYYTFYIYRWFFFLSDFIL